MLMGKVTFDKLAISWNGIVKVIYHTHLQNHKGIEGVYKGCNSQSTSQGHIHNFKALIKLQTLPKIYGTDNL